MFKFIAKHWHCVSNSLLLYDRVPTDPEQIQGNYPTSPPQFYIKNTSG